MFVVIDNHASPKVCGPRRTMREEEQDMTLITIAWIAFGLGTTLGFLLARSVESIPASLEHAKHDAVQT